MGNGRTGASRLSGFFSGLRAAEEPDPELEEREQLIACLQVAKANWKAAENRFNETTEPGLMDTVIYEEMAQRCRYQYLLQKAKEKGIRAV